MTEKDTILINKMYVGDYLKASNNIGHEVINLIKPDNENDYYIYITKDGKINKNYNVKTILFVKPTSDDLKYTSEVIAKCECPDFDIDEKKINSIKYKKQSLKAIFDENNDTHGYKYVTCKVKTLKVPSERLFISTAKDKYFVEKNKKNIEKGKKRKNEILFKSMGVDPEKQVIYLEGSDLKNNSKEIAEDSSKRQKWYIAQSEKKDAYDELKKRLENIEWKEISDKYNLYNNEDEQVNSSNFIDIVDKTHAEVTYSNLFENIFRKCPEKVAEFFENKDKNIKISKNFDIKREKGHIDLLLKDEKSRTLIVIENKIRSGINGIKLDENGNEISNQLVDYFAYVNGYVDKKTKNSVSFEQDENEYSSYKNKYYFIFAPNYNKLKEEDLNNNIKNYIKCDEKLKQLGFPEYKLVKYSELYEFFNGVSEELKNNIKYYNEFLYALSKHTSDTDNVLEVEMFRRFKRRIDFLNKEQE